jgi:hypothetical protein
MAASQPGSKFPPVIRALLTCDDAALGEALNQHASGDPAVAASERDADGYSALYYCVVQGDEACFLALLNAGADLAALARTEDRMYGFSGIRIFSSGGCTLLHACAEYGQPNIARLILDRCPNPKELASRLDNDGNDAAAVAQIFDRVSSTQILDMLGVPETERWSAQPEGAAERREDFRHKQRQRIEEASMKKEEGRVAAIQARYQPLHPALFDVFETCSSGSGGVPQHPGPPPMSASFDELLDPRFRALGGTDPASALSAMQADGSLVEICDEVWSLPVLSLAGRQQLLEETKHFEETMGDDVRRPNSMNAYGVVVTDFGLTPLLAAIANVHLTALSHMLFPEPAAEAAEALEAAKKGGGGGGGGDAGGGGGPSPSSPCGPFSSIHAFTIRYAVGEDTNLKEHRDDSQLTLNVCLGEEPPPAGVGFKGAAVFFKPDAGASGGTCCSGGGGGGAGSPGCKAEEPQEEVVRRVVHTVGHGLVHRGSIRHGTDMLEGGVRSNLVVWCRHRPPAPGQRVERLDPKEKE